ncbi:hypothetical protein CLG94_12430 [Candidatus Methylomirabilis limnetica]|uniref:O-antigen ligase-related domain-containing protein n=1 Tax=Candidatus Methylomirabilis limnetica TaxID=2033718 RepID=A0A2T4TUZ3_9BACT|nr:O-antigen ligase family protein [Candidatus Methylomirabilis limnetica]PTL34898.1 hypothetical protein CLG94_12430 [Candidatus Methylomirabilis limnetica]
MFQRTEVLGRPNRTAVWLGATIGAATVGLWLMSSLSRQDGIYWFLAGLDLVLSFIFYPFGVLQFIFLNLIGELTFEDASQLTPVRILGLVIVFRRLIDLAFRGMPLKMAKAPMLVWAFLFMLSLGVSIFASQDISESLTVLFTYVQLLIMFFLVIDFVRGEGEFKYLLMVFVLSSLVNAGFAIYQFHFENMARVGGTIGNANRFGIIQLVLLCLIAPVFGSLSAGWLRFAMWLALGPIAYSILLSFSRGAFVAAVAVLLYYLLFLRSGGVRPKVALVVVILAAFVLAPEGFYDRIDTIRIALSGTQLREGSIPTRLLYYRAGVQMGLDHPLTGVGLGQFNRHIATYANLRTVEARGAHNMYVSVFAETGIIGLIAFLGFLATSFVAVRGRQRLSLLGTRFGTAFANSAELGNTALLFGGLFASLEYSKVLWILLALAAAVRKPDNSEDVVLG